MFSRQAGIWVMVLSLCVFPVAGVFAGSESTAINFGNVFISERGAMFDSKRIFVGDFSKEKQQFIDMLNALPRFSFQMDTSSNGPFTNGHRVRDSFGYACFTEAFNSFRQNQIIFSAHGYVHKIGYAIFNIALNFGRDAFTRIFDAKFKQQGYVSGVFNFLGERSVFTKAKLIDPNVRTLRTLHNFNGFDGGLRRGFSSIGATPSYQKQQNSGYKKESGKGGYWVCEESIYPAWLWFLIAAAGVAVLFYCFEFGDKFIRDNIRLYGYGLYVLGVINYFMMVFLLFFDWRPLVCNHISVL